MLQVIGGVQRFHALKMIKERGHGMADRRCVVYGHGLSQAAALTLAQRHNETNQLQRATTFSEITGMCRRLIFSEFGEGQQDCVDGSMPIIPRYNTQSYRDFKAKCLSILVNTLTVRHSYCNHLVITFYTEHSHGRASDSDGAPTPYHIPQDATGLPYV